MQFTDASVVAGTRRREDGALLADVRIARTGIQLYRGSDVGRPDLDIVRVYRPGAEVFSQDTLKSAAHRPVTNDHPPVMVDADNWKQYAVGNTADEVSGEGIYLRVPLMVSDGAAIAAIEDGKRELSAGYTCTLDWQDGKTPAGEAYDAIQRNIRLNHVAIVDAGRAGPEVRIGDGAATWGVSPFHVADRKEPDMPDNLRTVVVDGLSVSTTDQGAQAIEKLTRERDEARTATKDAETAHQTALAAKDADLAKKDAEIDTLKQAQLSDADLDKKVMARAQLVADAKAISPDTKTEGLADAAIRKAVVVAKLGEAAVADKSDAYVDARFDILAEDAKRADPLRPSGGNPPPANPQQHQTRDAAHAAMVAGMTGAWTGQDAKERT
ncbi:MAG: DUF2213 domain-containing protein [Caulobacteraceae bacterium]|nr:DUF2213 domain-containing protein [Caulobacteraceae bacterium]